MSLPAPSPSLPVCITGASSGIGAELAEGLARRGHALLLVARRKDRLDDLAGRLRAEHRVQVDVHAADLADRAQRTALLARLQGGVGGLCNNAGYGSHGRAVELDRDWEVGMVELNVVAVHELTLGVLPHMVQRGSGAVLNLASLAAFQPLPTMATYAATKAFVHSFSEAVHSELAGTGVSVTSLCPGPVPTEFGIVAGAGAFSEDKGLPKPLSMDAPDVAEAGIRGMERGARTVVPGLTWKATSVSGRFTPRSALLPLVRAVASRV